MWLSGQRRAVVDGEEEGASVLMMLAKRALPAFVMMWAALVPAWAEPDDRAVTQEVLAIERAGMDGWLRGDPGPQLEYADPQITFIHDVAEQRIEGKSALLEFYNRYRGRPLFDSYEIQNPKVQVSGEVAVLSYQLAQRRGDLTTYWHGTQVYSRKREGWRVIHSHWSAVKPPQR